MVGAEPLFNEMEFFRVGFKVFCGDLMRAVRAFDGQSIDFLYPRPSFERLKDY